MAVKGQLRYFLWVHKTQKLKLRNFLITFKMIWRCAGDFYKVLMKFKMGATDLLEFFGGRKNLMSEIFQTVKSHSPRCGDVQVI